MKLRTVVANILNVPETTITDVSNAKNTANWDSASHIELMLAIEMAFDVEFSVAEITGLQNLGDMRQLLISKGVAGLELAAS